jgi:hypothetical protein
VLPALNARPLHFLLADVFGDLFEIQRRFNDLVDADMRRDYGGKRLRWNSLQPSHAIQGAKDSIERTRKGKVLFEGQSWGIIKLTRSFDEFLVGFARRDEAWIVAGIPLAWFITVPRRLLLWLYGDFGSVGFWQFWQCPLSAF